MSAPARRLEPHELALVEYQAGQRLAPEPLIAAELKLSAEEWGRLKREDAELRAALARGRAREHQRLVEALYSAATEDGNVAAATFLLRCRHGYDDRGGEAAERVNMTVALPKAENVPTQVTCSIHPWMSAYLFVRDDPYAAVSDEDGALRIDKLPVGKWSFKVWREMGYIKEASLGGKEAAWPRGTAEFEIHPGRNDIGEIKLSPKVFERR